MLIKTIQLETGDDELFSKSAPILTAASEVFVFPSSTPASLSLLDFPSPPASISSLLSFMTITVDFVKDAKCTQ